MANDSLIKMSNHLTTKPPFEKTEKPDTSKQVATKSAAEKIEKAEKMKVFEDKHVLKMLVYLTADFCRNHVSVRYSIVTYQI